MKKIIYLIAFASVFSFKLQGQILKDKMELEDYGLKGKVKKITYQESNQYGTQRYSYSFALDGRITKVENLGSLSEYMYDAERKLQKIYYKIGSKLNDSIIFRYDSKGHLVSKLADDLSVTYTYDSNGTKISMQVIYRRNDASITNFKYDTLGRIVKEVVMPKKEGGSKSYFSVAYDKNDNIISAIESGDINPKTYNQRIERSFSYNTHGDIISFTEVTKNYNGTKKYNSSVYSYTATYQYDSLGNWNKQTSKINNLEVDTVTRIIEYY
ncbi:hypothetical protein IMCC3317_14750 [Kordia antarctica]|uniref:YD repeat-containing protein n=1 Tax=Kordia antarctica TaxID=1218801 RepID=A0A7L4ZI11_9FLAO|nr:hypothetical protein [Kordia antarctica]QHI36121.1 hypothetical protein IMCC3317_14750 [Kordia antarctica]